MAAPTKLVPRDTLSARIETLSLPQAKGYADFIRTGDPDGPVPCWGAIAERFDTDFGKSAERKALWNVLVEAADRRPLLLFLHMNRGRPEVMAKVLEDAHRLPPVLQRTLVSLDEVAADVPAHLDRLDPAARQLWEAGPDAVAREREIVEARVKALTAFRYFVPDSFDPANEPGVKTITSTDVAPDQPAPGGTVRVAPGALAESGVTDAPPAGVTDPLGDGGGPR